MNQQKSVLKVGLAGLGVVGSEVARQLTTRVRRLARRQVVNCGLSRLPLVTGWQIEALIPRR